MANERLSVTRKDLVVTYFKDSGAGGQKRNKTTNCCRIHHPASGVTVQATKSRQQGQNKRAAMQALGHHPKFRAWLKIQMARPVDFLVEEQRRSPDGRMWWVPTGGVSQEEIDRAFSTR